MRQITVGGLTWTDVEDPTSDDITKLGSRYPFHPLNLDDCLSKRQLPKVDDYEDHVFVLLQFPVYDQTRRLTRESQLSMFLGRDFFVTIHSSELKSVGGVFEKCRDDEATRTSFMKSSTRVLYHVIDTLVNDLFPMLKKVKVDLEEVEDKVFDSRLSVALELMTQRRLIAELRRTVAPLRRLFLDMTVDAQRFSEEELNKYFGDIRDHIEKAWAVLEEAEETIEIYKDTDYVLSTELTNKVLSVLTIIFTLTIPATVVGAIYGMNVLLPGGIASGSPTFLGPFTAFILLMLIAFGPAIVMLLYFRRRSWL
ncbi:MAG: magnesium transporter CorA family protein [Thaumarchaeota archaeon]|nr:magnesium transporter CorA family protein [Nitrososphaerota archaeon]